MRMCIFYHLIGSTTITKCCHVVMLPRDYWIDIWKFILKCKVLKINRCKHIFTIIYVYPINKSQVLHTLTYAHLGKIQEICHVSTQVVKCKDRKSIWTGPKSLDVFLFHLDTPLLWRMYGLEIAKFPCISIVLFKPQICGLFINIEPIWKIATFLELCGLGSALMYLAKKSLTSSSPDIFHRLWCICNG